MPPFFRQVLGIQVVSKKILSQRTADYQNWVEAFARNHHTPIAWAVSRGDRAELCIFRAHDFIIF
jgi:hypothetical protein